MEEHCLRVRQIMHINICVRIIIPSARGSPRHNTCPPHGCSWKSYSPRGIQSEPHLLTASVRTNQSTIPMFLRILIALMINRPSYFRYYGIIGRLYKHIISSQRNNVNLFYICSCKFMKLYKHIKSYPSQNKHLF